jgi:peptide/nickel transport system permease protein
VRRVALAIVVGLFATALFADELASDLPVVGRVGGQLYLFPNIARPAALRAETLDSLRPRLDVARGDWWIEPLVKFGPNRTATAAALQPPGDGHWLGTDELGRDVLARLIHGTRSSLSVGLVAVAICVVIGVCLGALAGFYRGLPDALISRSIEVLIAFPTFFLILCVLSLVHVHTWLPLMLVIGLTRWTDVARLVRAEVLKLAPQAFVQASRALGASDRRIVFRHLVPNALAPVLVAATFGFAGAILVESALSFLGFGVPPPTPSWGELLTQAHRYLTHPGAWWLGVFPGVTIFLTVASVNLVGEGLRDALDPR